MVNLGIYKINGEQIYNEDVKEIRLEDSGVINCLRLNGESLIIVPERGWVIVGGVNKEVVGDALTTGAQLKLVA